MIKASCTWGDGPDVLLSFEDKPFILYEDPDMKGWAHGFVRNGSTDLTSDEAVQLAKDLLQAAKYAKELDLSLMAIEERDKRYEKFKKEREENGSR